MHHDHPDVMDRLRAVFFDRPSAAGWRRIVELADAGALGPISSAYADESLAAWADELRPLPAHWWNDISAGRPTPPHADLARVVVLGCRSPDADAAGLRRVAEQGLPIRGVIISPQVDRLSSRGAVLIELATGPLTEHLSTLKISGVGLVDSEAHILAGGRELTRLEILDFSNNRLRGRALQAIARVAPNLRELDLSGNELDAGLAAEGLALTLSGIERLALARTPLPPALVVSLAKNAPSLRELSFDEKRFGDEDWLALALAPIAASHLRWFRHRPLGDELAAALASHQHLPGRLDGAQPGVVDLPGISLGPHGLRRLAGASWWPSITRLDLSSNRLTGAGEGLSQGLSRAAVLTSLDLSDNPLGDAGAAVVGKHVASTIARLDLRRCQLTSAGATHLAGSPRLSALRALDLRGNPLGHDGVEALLASEHLRQLASLQVDAALMTPELWAQFLQHSGLADTDGVVRLAGIGIGEHLAALWRRVAAGELVDVDVSHNGIDAAGLAGFRAGTQLRRLVLANNPLGGAGLAAVADGLADARLEELNLAGCHLDDDALQHVERLPPLRALDLSDNRIGGEGLVHLEALRPSDLHLNLAGTLVGDEDREMLLRLGRRCTWLGLERTETSTALADELEEVCRVSWSFAPTGPIEEQTEPRQTRKKTSRTRKRHTPSTSGSAGKHAEKVARRKKKKARRKAAHDARDKARDKARRRARKLKK